MITIPTYQLAGLLKAAVTFAAADKEDAWFGVHLHWDGETLHVSGYDTLSGARMSWSPDDQEDESEANPVTWGGEDPEWRAFLSVLDAKEIVKTFKLPAKHAFTPISLKVTPTGGHLIVERSRETGHSEHLGRWASDTDRAARFPDVARIAGESVAKGAPPVTGMVYNPARLAAFAEAGAFGMVEMLFGDAGSPTAMVTGERFIGFLFPAGTNSSAASTGNLLGDDRNEAAVEL